MFKDKDSIKGEIIQYKDKKYISINEIVNNDCCDCAFVTLTDGCIVSLPFQYDRFNIKNVNCKDIIWKFSIKKILINL